MAHSSQLVNKARRNIVASLMVDIKVGMTFVKLASEAGDDSEKKDRNHTNARKAYDAVSRIGNRVELTTTEAERLTKALGLLKSALQKLGERF